MSPRIVTTSLWRHVYTLYIFALWKELQSHRGQFTLFCLPSGGVQNRTVTSFFRTFISMAIWLVAFLCCLFGTQVSSGFYLTLKIIFFFQNKRTKLRLTFFYLSILFLIHSSSESRERAYDHSPYGHHDRSGTFERQRHYNADYYRDRSVFATAGPGSSAIAGSFETTDPHFDSRIRDPFTLTNSTRRDLYRDDRGRRVDRTYHRRSRSSHSSQSRHPSPQRTTGQTSKTPHSPKRTTLSPGRGPRSRSHSRSSSSDSVSSTSSTGSDRYNIAFANALLH